MCELGACVEQPIEPDVTDVIDQELPSEDVESDADSSAPSDSEGPEEDVSQDEVLVDGTTPSDTGEDALNEDVDVTEDDVLEAVDVSNTEPDDAAAGEDSSDTSDVNQGEEPG
jgi:hypothetical protein